MNRLSGPLNLAGMAVLAGGLVSGRSEVVVVAAAMHAAALLWDAEPGAHWHRGDRLLPVIILAAALFATVWPAAHAARAGLLAYLPLVGGAVLVRLLVTAAYGAGGRSVSARRTQLDANQAYVQVKLARETHREAELRRTLAHLDRIRDVVRTIGFSIRVPDALSALARVACGTMGARQGAVRVRLGSGDAREYILADSGVRESGEPVYGAQYWDAARAGGELVIEDGGLLLARTLAGRQGDALLLEFPSPSAVAGALDQGTQDQELDTMLASEAADLLASITGLTIEKASLLEEIEARSRTDALTGLTNRRRFDELYAGEWERALRQESSCSMLMIDVDHFKSFNDTYGHAVGDLVLQAVARTLGGHVRVPDILARYGGEEFVVFLPETECAGAMILAERLRIAVATQRLAVPGQPLPLAVTVSIGTADRRHSTTAAQLQEAADAALYRAKKAGRNRAEV